MPLIRDLFLMDFGRLRPLPTLRGCLSRQRVLRSAHSATNGIVTHINQEKCFPYFAENHGCAVCIAVCPFSKAGYDQIKSSFERAEARRRKHDAVAERGV